MDFLFSTPAAAEDLTNAKAVLIIHVVHRGYNLGTFLGLGSALVVSTAKAIGGSSSKKPVQQSSPITGSGPLLSPLTRRVLLYGARGSLGGLAFGALAVTGRMWGRELIEWQDRAWRLLVHKTQTQTDHYSLAGAALGGIAGALVAQRMPQQRPVPVGAAATDALMATMRPRTLVLGATAVGSALAIVAMLGVRVLVNTGEQQVRAMS